MGNISQIESDVKRVNFFFKMDKIYTSIEKITEKKYLAQRQGTI